MVILLIYTSQVQVAHTITVNTPLLEVYSSLYEKYAETLSCPCTNIAIEQQEFISLIPTFHQICDSDFVDPRWPMGIQNTMQLFDYIYNRDFRMRGYSLFQALVSICALAKVSIGNALIDFKSTTFISKNLLSEKTFAAQMNASIDLYTTSLAYTFSRSFGIIRDTTQGNGLVSGTLSSITFRLTAINNTNTNQSIGTINPRYKTYDNDRCSCHDSATCKEQAYVYTPDNTKVRVYKVPGLVIGCYGFEAMLQSNLLCFYNQTCVDGLRVAINFSDIFTTSALDPSKACVGLQNVRIRHYYWLITQTTQFNDALYSTNSIKHVSTWNRMSLPAHLNSQ
ncbi:unnamed protein product [Rotaria sp. Silwood1]|nr:unnamed protein product [Rotaria sp. Silwood1]